MSESGRDERLELLKLRAQLQLSTEREMLALRQRLRRLVGYLEAIQSLSQAGNRPRTADEIAEDWAATVVGKLRLKAAVLLEVDFGMPSARTVASRGFPSGPAGGPRSLTPEVFRILSEQAGGIHNSPAGGDSDGLARAFGLERFLWETVQSDPQLKIVIAAGFTPETAAFYEPFEAEDWSFFQMMARHVEALIRNSRLMQALAQEHEILEDRVRLRTAELASSNDRLAETVRQLQETQAQLLQTSKLSALGEMAGGFAHEINNPLAIIQTLSSAIAGELSEIPGAPREAAQDLLRRLDDTVRRIAKIVQSLLLFSRESSGESVDVVAVETILEETLALCSERFKGAGVRFEILCLDKSMTVKCRKVQVSQVLLNLFNNAFDAIEVLPERWIRVQVARNEDGFARIDVVNSGPRISEEVRGRLFQPFFTTKKKLKGTGLGLSLSRNIMSANGGTVELDSASSNTCFSVRLPLASR